MGNLKLFLANAAISLFLPSFLFFGCSLIGLAIGAGVDASSSRGEEISIVQLRGLTPGTTITFFMRDGRRIEGDYASFTELSPDAYRVQYSAALELLGTEARLPPPGDSVVFAHRNSPNVRDRGVFRGIDVGTMVVNNAGRRVFVADLSVLRRGDGSEVDLRSFSNLINERRLPFLTESIILRTGRDTAGVLLAEVVRVEMSGSKGSGKLIGLGIGAVIDVVVITSIKESLEHPKCEKAPA